MSSGFSAVVVAYYPERETLANLVCTLRTVVSLVWIVDNTPQSDSFLQNCEWEGVRVLQTGENLGVAGAYNLAAKRTQQDSPDAHSLFLFDQDSEPDCSCIRELMSAMLALRQRGERVAQVGPVYYEKQRAFFPPLILVEGGRLRRIPIDQADALHRVSYMISSGSLVSLCALTAVGDFDEGLFIDYVDVEFGLRCQHKGFSSWVVKAARMNHSIGEAPLRLGPWTLPSHSGLRRRYQARNAVLLMRSRWIPTVWKFQEFIRAVCRFVFMLAARNGMPGQLSGWLQGVRDGLRNKRGAICQEL